MLLEEAVTGFMFFLFFVFAFTFPVPFTLLCLHREAGAGLNSMPLLFSLYEAGFSEYQNNMAFS